MPVGITTVMVHGRHDIAAWGATATLVVSVAAVDARLVCGGLPAVITVDVEVVIPGTGAYDSVSSRGSAATTIAILLVVVGGGLGIKLVDVDGVDVVSVVQRGLMRLGIAIISLEELLEDIVLLPDVLRRGAAPMVIVDPPIVAVLAEELVHGASVLDLPEDLVDAKFDSADFALGYCVLAHVGIVIQNELEFVPEQLLS